jgi:transcriptional regulator with XRE-family HTH domain
MRRAWSGLGRGKAGRNRPSSNPDILGRRCCPHCGRWRPISDFSARNGTSRPHAWCITCVRVRSRQRYREFTRHQREARRESNRINQSFYRERDARAQGREIKPHKRVDRIERVMLLRGPLLLQLQAHGGLVSDLARRANVSERTLTRLMNDGGRYVRLDTADRLAYAMGVPLELIYCGQPAWRVGSRAVPIPA